MEEMKAKGLGGFVIYYGTHPPGFATQPRFKHLLAESERLGLTMGVNNCCSWPSGGPWMTATNRPWMIVCSKLDVEGGKRLSVRLPMPYGRGSLQTNLAVQAFPLPDGEIPNFPVVTASSNPEGLPGALDINYNTVWQPVPPADPKAKSEPNWLLVDFGQSRLVDYMWLLKFGLFSVEVSDDGKNFKQIARLGAPYFGPFPATQTRYVRVIMPPTNTQANDAVRDFAIGTRAEVERQRQLGAKRGLQYAALPTLAQRLEVIHSPLPSLPNERALSSERMVDLTTQLQPDGTLEWDAPPGRWRVVRVMATTLDKVGDMAIPDHLSLSATRQDFELGMGKMGVAAGAKAGAVLQYYHEDNHEISCFYNWTPTMLDEFQKRRGYDARAFLAATIGEVVGSAERTDRFLYDWRRTVADCVAENHYAEWTRLAHQQKVQTRCEAGGPYLRAEHAHDALANLSRVDRMVGEFWADMSWAENPAAGPAGLNRNSPLSVWEGAQNIGVKQVACASHLYGKPIVDMESFTALGRYWETMPRDLLLPANIAFCEGVNQMAIHASVPGDLEQGSPGEVYVGTLFNTKNTWWPYIAPFVQYLHRCSSLLRQGQFVGDVLYYLGDDAPVLVPPKHTRESLGAGYDYDECNSEALLQCLTVQDGQLVSRSGSRYRLLVLPELPVLSLPAAKKIREFVQAGVPVLGPKPTRTPGLADYPKCDAELKAIVDELWGREANGARILYSGKGGPQADALRGLGGASVCEKEALHAMGLGPDFAYTAVREAADPPGRDGGPAVQNESDALLDFIHRRDGEADIYFVINRRNRPQRAECVFRVSGKRPELWNAVTGQRRPAPAFRQAEGRTAVPLELPAYGSIFVVFRERTEQPAAVGPAFVDGKPVLDIPGPWAVRFDPKWGGPEKPVVFDQLTDWTSHPCEGIKHYSGTATYRTTFVLGRQAAATRLLLDLGVVNHLAVVRLNGQNLGVVWCAPWQVDITTAARDGRNELEIDVVNPWLNRLLADLNLPVEKRVTAMPKRCPPSPREQPRSSGLLGPVRVMMEE